jgi:hypothetical protein
MHIIWFYSPFSSFPPFVQSFLVTFIVCVSQYLPFPSHRQYDSSATLYCYRELKPPHSCDNIVTRSHVSIVPSAADISRYKLTDREGMFYIANFSNNGLLVFYLC